MYWNKPVQLHVHVIHQAVVARLGSGGIGAGSRCSRRLPSLHVLGKALDPSPAAAPETPAPSRQPPAPAGPMRFVPVKEERRRVNGGCGSMNDTFRKKRRRGIARFQEIDRSRHRPERLRLLLRQMCPAARSIRSRAPHGPWPSGAVAPRRAATSGNRCPGCASCSATSIASNPKRRRVGCRCPACRNMCVS